MSDMHINDVDLNLLMALDVLLDECHITKAANRLMITQPAMSRTLVRLRETFNDQLIVRTPNGYLPTTRGQALVEPVKNILAQIQFALSEPKFDPASDTGQFRICTLGYGEVVIVPTFMKMLANESANVRITIVNRSVNSVVEILDDQADIMFGAIFPEAPKTCIIQQLYEDQYVCVMSKNHPLAKHDLTLEGYLEYPHSIIHTGQSPGTFIDTVLAEQGHKRRIAKLSPHWSSSILTLEKTDLLQTVPGLMAKALASTGKYVVKQLPFDLDATKMNLMWHSRNNQDPRHMWFRNKFIEAAKIVRSEI